MEHAPMRMYVSQLYFVIKWLEKQKFLIMERNTHRIYSTGYFNFSDKGVRPEDIFFIDIYLLLGVIPIETVLYIAVVTKADLKGEILGKKILEIKSAQLIEFNISDHGRNLESHKSSILKLLSSGFYFSYNYKLTIPIRQGLDASCLHEGSDKRFYWNLELYKEFIDQGVELAWFIPIIQGFISIYRDDSKTLALISRRSCKRAGTRYNCRGIDDKGHVANFVETEQILIISDTLFGYLQIRGSVPLYWEQTGVTAQLNLTKSREKNVLGFKLHSEKLIKKYKHITMINLLSSSKSHELFLTKELETIFNILHPKYSQNLIYTYFDFHASCKGQKYEKVSLLIENISNFLNYYSFYSSLGDDQNGVVRTNCLDCLDRTNVVQSIIAWEVLVKQLMRLNLDTIKQDTSFLRAFKTQWADNGDNLSLQYTGTNSTISAVTREGPMGLRGLINQGITSINRFYYANIQDDIKQISIDSILRKKNKIQIVNKIQEELNKRTDRYIRYIDIKIRVVTWNLSGGTMEDITSLTQSELACDIVLYGFQKVKDFQCDKLDEAMSEYFKLTFRSNGDYVIVVYVHNNFKENVSELGYKVIELPLRGRVTNKAAMAIEFRLCDSYFCFISCHLVSGVDNNSERKEQIQFIQNHIFCDSKGQPKNFDAKVLFGDLNFRINLGTVQVISHLKNQNFSELFKAEQLIQSLKYGYLPYFKEDIITFPPTYPYIIGTDEYDSFNRRSPSWSDRILYNGNLASYLYSDIKTNQAAHKPVEGQFSMKIKKIDLELKSQTEKQIYEEFTTISLTSLPKIDLGKNLLSCN
jgi:synaptojanin